MICTKSIGEIEDLNSGYLLFDYGFHVKRASYPKLDTREWQRSRVYDDELEYFNSGYWQRPAILKTLDEQAIRNLERIKRC